MFERRSAVGTATATARRLLTAIVAVTWPLTIAGCFSITAEPRALLQRDDGSVQVQSLACGRAVSLATRPPSTPRRTGFDGAIRLLTWNIHKEGDAGWEQDLREFSARHDILLLQEIVLRPPLEGVIEDAGLRWVMASSFFDRDIDIGVLTAARIAPIASCTQRVIEPVLRLPKSAVITWFPLHDRDETLAVVNVHAINFALTLGAYRAQFEAIAEALTEHRGPLVLAGDFNTWTAARAEVVEEVAKELRLTPVVLTDDRRRVFFGHQLDYIYVRGLDVVEASATPVTSSDHNPVAATLRVAN